MPRQTRSLSAAMQINCQPFHAVRLYKIAAKTSIKGAGSAALFFLLRQFNMVCGDIIKIIVAIFLPPLGVFLEVGCSGAFWLNLILTFLGYIPGIIHALYIILTR